METTEKTRFNALLEPCAEFLITEGEKIDKKADSKKLFFANFFKIIVFGIVGQVKTLKLLTTELKSSPTAKTLELVSVPYNTLRDGFHRFNYKYFEKLFSQVLQSFQYKNVPELEELGAFRLIDGSIFPTLACIFWAEYKSKKNAIKLHLSFNLNQMIPSEFLVDTGNSCERSFLKSILRESITYIADRGYFSFEVIHKISKAMAFYILRCKSNLVYTITETLAINSILPECFNKVSDVRAKLDNDPNSEEVRVIEFLVEKSHFVLITNRFDLSTLQIILLYAYRWQIELLFKFIKRSLGGIHLFNHSQNGVTVQFYILMIVAILQLKLKQECIDYKEKQEDNQTKENSVNVECQSKSQRENKQSTQQSDNLSKPLLETNVEEFTKQALQKQRQEYSSFVGKTILKADVWIQSANRIFEKYWKISCHWLCKLKNFLALPFSEQIVKELAT